MSKKRLAIFGVKYFPSQGGTSRVAESIIRELKDKYDITIYCYKDPKASSLMNNVTVIQIPRIPFGAIGVFLYFAICCLHLIFSRRYDLIHVHKTDAAFFIPILRLISKVIATSHEAPYIRDKWNGIEKAYFKWMERVFVKSGVMLTSVSKPLSEYYNKTYGTQVRYVPNGVELNDTRDPEGAEQILEQFNIKDGYLFFAAKRIMSTKGCHTFLEAMRKINYKGTIVIAGQPSHSSHYMKKLEELSAGLDVKFVGFVKGIPKLMSMIEKARLFIFPSEIEGLSIMLLEVGSTGKTPLICSDIPENTQVFSDDHVLFFRDKNADDLAEKFQWAEKNMDLMLEKAQLARKHIIEEYSSEAFANKYDSLYQELIQ